jgi:hypothetical protein
VTKPVRVDYDRIERHEFEIYKESILQRLDIYIHKRMPEYSGRWCRSSSRTG